MRTKVWRTRRAASSPRTSPRQRHLLLQRKNASRRHKAQNNWRRHTSAAFHRRHVHVAQAQSDYSSPGSGDLRARAALGGGGGGATQSSSHAVRSRRHVARPGPARCCARRMSRTRASNSRCAQRPSPPPRHIIANRATTRDRVAKSRRRSGGGRVVCDLGPSGSGVVARARSCMRMPRRAAKWNRRACAIRA